MKKVYFSLLVAYLLVISPVSLLAQSFKPPVAPSNFSEIICIFVKLILDFIPYVVVLAVGAFFFGLIKYVRHGDNEEKRAEGNKLMIYGIVGFFFIVSIWGILKLFVASFGLEKSFGVPQFKGTVQTSGGSSDFANSCTWFFTGGN